MKKTDYDFTQIAITALRNRNAEKETKDSSQGKRYRGGNAGVLYNGMPANSCARKLIARSEGRFEEQSYNTDLMFQMGNYNETRWLDILKDAGYKATSADDLVSTQTKSGLPVTGSPDIIIYKDDKPDYLIELKHISSFWTFRDKVIEGKPSLEHLAQAGFYSMHLNDIPFCVLYTASVKFSGPSFLTNLVPKPTEPGSENFEYTYYNYTGKTKTYRGKSIKEKKKLIVPGHLMGAYPKDLYKELGANFAEFKNTIPTIVQYDLRWNNNDTISYKHNGKWHETIVSKKTIMDFYEYTEKCENQKRLPKRPLNLDPKGEAKGFNSCDYCSLSETCDRYESDFDTWLREAKLINY